MNNKVIELISKFEDNINQTKKMTEVIKKFDESLNNLEKGISKVNYFLKIDDLHNTSNLLIKEINNMKDESNYLDLKHNDIIYELEEIKKMVIENNKKIDEIINDEIIQINKKLDVLLKNMDESKSSIAITSIDRFLENVESVKYFIGECINNRYKLNVIFKYREFKLGKNTCEYIDELLSDMKKDKNTANEILTLILEYVDLNIERNKFNEHYIWFKKLL